MSDEFMPKTYTLRKAEIELISAKSKEMDSPSDSAALRAILREWALMKSQLPLPGVIEWPKAESR